ncbi:MAG TPA: hypothetical protein VM286_00275 [Candidatus Thermoplasmatota archaeon]|nr:hypothetical protein [Candidatus Thermoplasmatota archaeon]
MRRQRDLLGLAAAACLAAAGAIEGLLLATGPVLRDYSAVRLGPHGIFVSLPWLCVLGFAALGAIAGLASWLRTLFLTLLCFPITWSLARASQHPWWLVKSSMRWSTQPIGAAVLAGHAMAIALVCASVLIDALVRSRAADARQGVEPGEVHRTSVRLAGRGVGLVAACFLLAFLLPGVLEPMAAGLRGAVQGTNAFAVLLASIVLLLLGLALLSSPGRSRRRPQP